MKDEGRKVGTFEYCTFALCPLPFALCPLPFAFKKNMPADRNFISLNIAILVVSDSRTDADDISGKTLAERATDEGTRLSKKK